MSTPNGGNEYGWPARLLSGDKFMKWHDFHIRRNRKHGTEGIKYVNQVSLRKRWKKALVPTRPTKEAQNEVHWMREQSWMVVWDFEKTLFGDRMQRTLIDIERK